MGETPVTGTRVLLGMSGGVDSSCAAAILLESGYHVEGATLVTGDQGFSAAEDAAAVARQLGIGHHVLDVRDRFDRTVIRPFIDSYRRGRTPNPCVLCNPDLKFAVLIETADRLGCSRVATGHYASLGRHPETGRWSLQRSRSGHKDQSYFLYRLTQRQLSRILFPLEHREKEEIREDASRLGLLTSGGMPMAKKKDSQDICFLPDGDYRRYIMDSDAASAAGPDRPGDILNTEGMPIGRHNGLTGFTVGQRKGFEVRTTERLYVLSINADQNTVTVGSREETMKTEAYLESPVYSGWESIPSGSRLQIRVRSSAVLADCTAVSEAQPEQGIRVVFDQPVFAPAPGQSGVLYDGMTVVAGGFLR